MITDFNTAVTVLRKGIRGEDDYGNPIEEILTETIPALVGWGSTGTDFGIERDTVSSQGTIYFPNNINIPTGTEFVISGRKYRMTGEQTKWQAPEGWGLETGSIIEIIRVVG